MSESFASLFEAEAKQSPKRGQVRSYRTGEPVEGLVVSIGKDAVFVALDGKQEGFLESNEVTDADGNLTLKVGDVVRAMIVDAGRDGAPIKLGKSAPKGRGADGLISAKEAGLAVEGLVTGVNKGGLEVTVDGVRAFCPARAADNKFVGDLNGFVGQKLQFLVTQVKDGGREVVLSRRAVLDREAAEARAKIQDKLVVGAVLRGNVTSLRDFGAFVDLGGLEALLPASELSHDRSVRPADVVKIGDAIDVQILKIEPDEKRQGQQKITLSLKALAQDPWETAAEAFAEGSIKQGRVMRLTAFGAFVQLAGGIDGLLHISELSGELDEAGKMKLPVVGDQVSVRVLKVDVAQRRIALAPSDAPVRAPGTRGASAPAASLRQGAIVKGKVSGVERFGVFVQIEGNQGRGLLPAQELLKTRAGDLHKLFPVGMDITAKIVALDGSGKIRLSIEQMKADEERASFEDFRAKESARGGGMGALGQKLAKAGLLAGAKKGK